MMTTLTEIVGDRIALPLLVTTAITILFKALCVMRDAKSEPWDVVMFASSIGGIVAALWMIGESALNVGHPPGHWRIYVVIVSLGFASFLFDKCRGMWPRRLKPPGEK
jgi:hypothetical protein